MRITRVYTKTGDDGTTGLADGSRIAKDDVRIEAYGSVDELNSILALCLQTPSQLRIQTSHALHKWLHAIQNDLFVLGADLATPVAKRWKGMNILGEEDVRHLEHLIDSCQAHLAPLRDFVLPGGSLLNAHLHLARTVCRRAERNAVALQQREDINRYAVIYLNRLSDFFFVLSRWIQHELGLPEEIWNKEHGIRQIFPEVLSDTNHAESDESSH